jgi:nucleoside 2-deoxyribosyltransferase
MQSFGTAQFSESNNWRLSMKNKFLAKYDGNRYSLNVISPNNYYNFLDDSTYDSWEEVMNFDLYKVRNSNLIIVNFNDVKSLGTMAEVAIAYDRRIPIVSLCTDKSMLHPWQEAMSSKIFTNADSLVEYCIKYYLN